MLRNLPKFATTTDPRNNKIVSPQIKTGDSGSTRLRLDNKREVTNKFTPSDKKNTTSKSPNGSETPKFKNKDLLKTELVNESLNSVRIESKLKHPTKWKH